jgi:hypothetical protein
MPPALPVLPSGPWRGTICDFAFSRLRESLILEGDSHNAETQRDFLHLFRRSLKKKGSKVAPRALPMRQR